jgi:branched-chain amino acid transport system substrate-binding protein
MRQTVVVLAGLALLAAGCGKSGHASGGTVLIAVDLPVTGSPYVAQTIRHGVELATAGIDQGGGLIVGNRSYRVHVKVYDNHLSARRAVEDTRSALDSGAVAIITDGTGIDATWQIANRDHVPICIVYDGGSGLVDAESRPNVFRIAPTNHGIAFRYAEYLIPKHLKVALLHDDSGYGQEGSSDLNRAFSGNPESVATKLTLPAGSSDLSAQILRVRRSGANALLVWGQPSTIAAVLTAARSLGWSVPVYTPPTGADPYIRQRLADHTAWVDGLTFAGGRLTAEVGTGPFLSFESQYSSTYGADRVGVRDAAGKQVVQPPEFAMYAYDFAHVLIAALTRAGSLEGSKVLGALNQVTTQGANGDERGFNEHSHEGVVIPQTE